MLRKIVPNNMDFPDKKSEYTCNFPCNMSADDGLNKTNNHTNIPAMDPPGKLKLNYKALKLIFIINFQINYSCHVSISLLSIEFSQKIALI